jgi:hypothetical protein
MPKSCVKEGVLDGVHPCQIESVDATPMDFQATLIPMLRAIVKNSLTKMK